MSDDVPDIAGLDIPDLKLDGGDAFGHAIDGPPQIIMPAHFAAPHNMPVHFDVTGAYDEHGQWWVILRVETVHGSHIAFMNEESAVFVQDEIQKARKAKATTPFIAMPGDNGGPR